jgi:hypothetical protein
MLLVNPTPLPVALVPNAEEDRMVTLLLVAATYRVGAPGLELAEAQQPLLLVPPMPLLGDGYPAKQGVSVCVTGFVHAPGGQATRAEARLRVGDVARTVAAFGPRVWREGAGGALAATAPLPFDRVEMTWANAYGGGVRRPTRVIPLPGGGEAIAPEHDEACVENPDGIGWYPERADALEQPLAPLEDAEEPVRRFDDQRSPACFAPYPIYGGLRAAAVARGEEVAWAEHGRVLTRSAPWTTFASIPAGTPLEVGGMRAAGEVLAFEVPEPPVTVDVAVGPRASRLRLDTDAIDIDAEAATARVVWRAVFAYPLVQHERRVALVRATDRLDAMVTRGARAAGAAAEG